MPNVTILESVLANQISRDQTAILASKIISVFQPVKIANVTKLDRPHSNVHWKENAIATSDTQGLNVQNAPKTTSETKMVPVKLVFAMTSVLYLHNANPTVSAWGCLRESLVEKPVSSCASCIKTDDVNFSANLSKRDFNFETWGID